MNGKRVSKYLAALLASFALALALGACGGGGSSSGSSDAGGASGGDSQQESFENITFDVGDLSVDIHGSEVVYDAAEELDNLVLYVTVTNNGDEAFAPYDLDVSAEQGTENLRVTQLREDGHFILDTNMSEDIEPGESVELVYGWQIKWYDRPVVATFGSYDADEDTVVEFDVTGTETDEHAAIASETEGEGYSQVSEDEANITGAYITLPNDEWYFDSVYDYSAKAKNDGNGASVSISYNSTAESAMEAAETTHANFANATDITTVTINGVEWVRYDPVPDSQFMLYGECPSGGVIEVYGMFAPYEDCMDLLESIELL